MDIAETTAPKSDQQNYDDYVGGPKTVTVTEVKKGSAEQPVEVHLAEFPGRPFKPSKSMRRVLLDCWGTDSTVYAGRKMTLYGDPDVKFGGQTVGGIRIAALSNLEKATTIALTVSRGKRAPFTVQPLDVAPKPKDTSGRDWLKELAQTEGDLDLIKSLGAAASSAHAGDPVLSIIRDEYKRVVALTVAEPSE
jgi:hypothetical protein